MANVTAIGSMSSGARKRCSATSAAPIVSSSSDQERRAASRHRSLFFEDSDPRLQRAHEDGEEDDGERRQEARGHRAAGLLEREGECDRHCGRERGVADQGSVAVVLAEDREQRAGREEHDESADVDEGASARPAWTQRVGWQQSLDRHVTSVTRSPDGERAQYTPGTIRNRVRAA